jgi:hypothetical protein
MPSTEHQDRVCILEELARLMDFSFHLSNLPDGSRPDVCRFDPATNGIFMGEAKATEAPQCRATRMRFLNYLRWLAESRAASTSSVCAICFSDHKQTTPWKVFLTIGLKATNLANADIHARRLDADLGIVWATLGKAGNHVKQSERRSSKAS